MSHTNPPPPQPSAGQGPPPAVGHDHSHGGTHGADYLHNPETAHEHSDVNLRMVLGFAIGLFVVVVMVFLLMGGFFRVLESRAASNDPAVSPLTRPPTQMPASQMGNPVFGRGTGGPQLLTSEPSVLLQQQTMEQSSLGTYGWIDEKAGVARIPIAEAKKLILQRGLPARAEPADPGLGTRRAAFGESSSGRIITPPAAGPGAPAPPAAPAQSHGQ